MKIKITLVGVVAMLLAASFLPVQANTFFTGKKLTIQGTIHQSEDSVTGAPARVMPFSIANIFKCFPASLPDAPPENFRYYYDATTGAFVIAGKGIPNGGEGTATLVIFNDGTGVEWPTKENKSSGGGSNNGSSGLSGAYQLKRTRDGDVLTSKFSFVAFGTIEGRQTVLKATITYVDPDAP
jgi:hypothetical protein